MKLCGNEHQEKVKHNKRTTLHNKARQHSPLNIRFRGGGGGGGACIQLTVGNENDTPIAVCSQTNRIGSKVGRRKKQR